MAAFTAVIENAGNPPLQQGAFEGGNPDRNERDFDADTIVCLAHIHGGRRRFL